MSFTGHLIIKVMKKMRRFYQKPRASVLGQLSPAAIAAKSNGFNSSLAMEEICKMVNRKAIVDLANEEARIASMLWETALWRELMIVAHTKGIMTLSEDLPADGRVLQIIQSNLYRFVKLCFTGKRECTFDSLLSWAHSLKNQEAAKGLPFGRLASKACRKAWKALPKSLKRGKEMKTGEILYSTTFTSKEVKEAIKCLNEERKFLSTLSYGWAKRRLSSVNETLVAFS